MHCNKSFTWKLDTVDFAEAFFVKYPIDLFENLSGVYLESIRQSKSLLINN